jgi:hypothetical protein
MHISAASSPDQVVGGLHQQVEPLLRTDHADIPDQVRRTLLQLGPRRAQLEVLDLRPRAHDEDVLGRHAAARARDLGVGFVGGDRDNSAAERQPLDQHHQPPEQPPPAKLGLVELRADIMMVEEVAHAERAQRPGDKEDQVGRVATVQDVDAPLAPDPQR